MRITHVELHNIKSYRGPVRLELTAGLNAVCGLNGSGKSTLLEAIGFALFDSLPYPQQSFIREGEKSGTVRVGLLGRDDRVYEVARKVGSGATHYVADIETGTRIADRKETLSWVKERALDIEPEIDLDALFTNAVGVPQGQMTADFMGTPGSRKAVFDPLLRVEEYRQAYEYLRETVSSLRERTAGLDAEIMGLRDQTERIPSKAEELGRLKAQVHDIEVALAKLRAICDDLERQTAELDKFEARLHELEVDLRGAEYDLNRHQEMLLVREEQLAQAVEARRIVGEAERGYRAVLAARECLAELERERLDRDRLNEELAAARSERQGFYGQIEQLDNDRAGALEAAGAAAELVEKVSRQETLERALLQRRAELRDAGRLDIQIERLRREIEQLERTGDELDRSITRARSAQSEIARTQEVQGRLDEVAGLLARVAPMREQRDAIKEEGRRLRSEFDRLSRDVARREELAAELTVHEPGAGRLEELLSRQVSALERNAKAAAATEYQSFARQDLLRTTCPILSLTCPVVAADSSVLERIDRRDAELAAESAELKTELDTLEQEVSAGRVAADAVQRLRLELAALAGAREDLQPLEERLVESRRRYAELSESIDSVPAWEDELKTLRERMSQLRTAEADAARLPLLEEQQQRDRDVLQLQQRELAELHEDRERLRVAEEQSNALEAELAELGNPKAEQQRLLTLAARLPEIEASLKDKQGHLADAAARVKALTGQLQRYEGLDKHVEEQRAIEMHYAGDHERLLRFRGDAETVEQRTTAVQEVTVALERARTARAKLEERLAEVRTGYDPERHAELREQCREASDAVTRQGANLEHVRGDLGRIQLELNELRVREERLRARESERDNLAGAGRAIAFIRDTIRAAGPVVTESLLANISQMANDIYAEIIDDHAAELRWDRDYEVLVQRGAETRKFAQLSGGEQMSAALSVRLALLKEMSEVDFAFFDEPTQNMDAERRGNLADQIRQVRGFDQLIVISHDDTFEHHTDNLIRLQKVHEETQVE